MRRPPRQGRTGLLVGIASDALVEAVFREEWGRTLAILVRTLGDVELAEDAVQEAFAAALERWPRDGAPDNPGAWLLTTARNRAIDRIRRERTLAHKTELLAALEEIGPEAEEASSIPDERLSLIFACCHPALSTEAQVALTLRALGGLSTAEIARELSSSRMTLRLRLHLAYDNLATRLEAFRAQVDRLIFGNDYNWLD